MLEAGLFGLILIAMNCLVSFLGLRNPALKDKYCFEVNKILVNKEYIRLLTSGFLHVSWLHLLFNMFSLYFFSNLLEAMVGHWIFLLIYFISLIGGNLLALLIHKNNGYYRAIGASGAVSGIIFSSIALFPGLEISLFVIPVPSWIFALGYVLITLYGIRSKRTNIGHEAHLGGALAGMFTAIAFYPQVVVVNYLPILAIVIPTILYIVITSLRPGILTFNKPIVKPTAYTIDDKYNEEKVNKEKEIDRILEKIHQKGIDSLTARERIKLDEYSKNK
jgi:membrane associated rhomboid family serine protease